MCLILLLLVPLLTGQNRHFPSLRSLFVEKAPGKFETEVPGGTVIAQSGSVEYHTTDRNFVLSFDYAAQVSPISERTT